MRTAGADDAERRAHRPRSSSSGRGVWRGETEKVAAFYDGLVTGFGLDPRALDWGSRESQHTRFAVLSQVGDLAGCSVLDVGCGVADLYDFLAARDVAVDYTGFDIAPTMVATARRRFPGVDLRVVDILAEDVERERFDFVVSSGLFSLRQKRPYEYLATAMRQMYAICQRGIAANSLSARSSADPTIEDGRFLADPERVLAMCLDISPRVVLRHDYLPHDFTVYLYR